jgi:hypothetical protein
MCILSYLFTKFLSNSKFLANYKPHLFIDISKYYYININNLNLLFSP